MQGFPIHHHNQIWGPHQDCHLLPRSIPLTTCSLDFKYSINDYDRLAWASLLQPTKSLNGSSALYSLGRMGYKQDQTLPSQYEYPRPEDEPDDVLPSYSETVNGDHGNEALNTRDPRSTSTESLNPEVDSQKRTLLLIYIHGFLGDETSFQSFPAHVHNLTCTLLSESHVVHTKIYPRYKSRKVIEFARNDFSNW